MRTFLLSFIAIVTAISVNAQSKDKTLVVYYSRSGNTQAVAGHIQKLTGADIFQVETVKSYPEDHQETVDIAKEEKNNNARPEIKGKINNIDSYKTIYIGFPIWHGTYPMAIATFMETYNLEGKTVIPFCTHGSGGVDQGFTDVVNATSRSAHKEGLNLNGSEAASAYDTVEKWLRRIGMIPQ